MLYSQFRRFVYRASCRAKKTKRWVRMKKSVILLSVLRSISDEIDLYRLSALNRISLPSISAFFDITRQTAFQYLFLAFLGRDVFRFGSMLRIFMAINFLAKIGY